MDTNSYQDRKYLSIVSDILDHEEFNKIGWEILNLGKWKKVIQMKRKLDPNKIYAFIGRVVTFLTTIVLLNIANYHLAIYILDNCITVYR